MSDSSDPGKFVHNFVICGQIENEEEVLNKNVVHNTK